jgi:hypothetical protein
MRSSSWRNSNGGIMSEFKKELLKNFQEALENLPDNIRDHVGGTYDLILECYHPQTPKQKEHIKSFRFEFVELDNNSFQLEEFITEDRVLVNRK